MKIILIEKIGKICYYKKLERLTKRGVFLKSTVAAIATALGSASVSVIRISGDNAAEVADRVFRAVSGKKIADQKGYTALYGEIVDKEQVLDTAVALNFRAPKSYTGENVVELSVHGGAFVAKRVLRAVLENGAVAAAPGEFTKRAFMNGKLDLAQAEAVMGVISAGSESELKFTLSALSGRVSREIEGLTERLLGLCAKVAFFNDNPDEEIPELGLESFSLELSDISREIKKLISDYDSGRIIRSGIDTVIVGKPNVGKSTLMNLLAGRDRSIVTEIAGTTRDVIEDTVSLGDLTLRLSDTAGIHETADEVESVGIRLARERSDTAQLVLAVFDLSRPLDSDDKALIEEIQDKNAIVVLNKSDISIGESISAFGDIPVVEISAKNGIGKDALADKIAEVTGARHLDPDSAVLGSERQRDCAYRAGAEVDNALDALQSGLTIDAVGVLIDEALSELYKLTGQRVTNTATDEVFKRFCVGK